MGRKTPTSRAEALKMQEKRQKKVNIPSEDRLQAEIVRDFADKHPERRGQLFLIDNNADNVASMGKKITLGLVKNISDLILSEDGYIVGLELKTTDSKHDAEHCKGQAIWIRDWCYRGGFIVSKEMFWDVYNKKSNGIPPEFVIDYIKETGLKTLNFGKIYQKYLESIK